MFVSGLVYFAQRGPTERGPHRRILNLESAWIMDGQLYLSSPGGNCYTTVCSNPQEALAGIEDALFSGRTLLPIDP